MNGQHVCETQPPAVEHDRTGGQPGERGRVVVGDDGQVIPPQTPRRLVLVRNRYDCRHVMHARQHAHA